MELPLAKCHFYFRWLALFLSFFSNLILAFGIQPSLYSKSADFDPFMFTSSLFQLLCCVTNIPNLVWSNHFNMFMDSVSFSQYDGVPKAYVTKKRTKITKKKGCNSFRDLSSEVTQHHIHCSHKLPRSHILEGEMSESYYRKSMRDDHIIVPIFGKYNVLHTTQTLINLVGCSLSGIISSHHWLLTGGILPFLFWALVS